MKKILTLVCALALLTVALNAAPALAAPPGQAHTAAAEHGHPTPKESVSGEKEKEGGEAAEHEHHLGPINWFDFSNKEQPPWGAYAINFAILVGIYVYFGKDAIKKGLVNRRANIKREIDDAQRMLKEAEKRAERYQKKLQDIDADVESAKKTLAESGVAEQERIIKEAREKAARMDRDAEFLVEQERKQAREDLLRETLALAVSGAEEVLRRGVSQADHERLAEEYLEQLASMTAQEFDKRGALR